MAIAASIIMKSNVNKPDSWLKRIGFSAVEYSLIPHGAGKYHTALNYTVRFGLIRVVFTGIPKCNVQSVTRARTCIGI